MSAALSMTELSPSQNDQPTDGAQQTQSLRQLREAAGLPLAALAATLKVPVERLQALEEGRFQDLPNLTFARALASSVCRALKVDPAPVLLGLPQLGGVKLGSDSPAPAVMDQPRRRLPPALALRSPMIWAALLLLLAILLWWWLPQSDADPVAQTQVESQPVSQGVVVESVTPAGQPLPAPEVQQSDATAAQAAPAALPVAAVSDQPAAASASQPAAEKPAVPAAVMPLLQLRASATTWIQLKDSSGKELLQRTLQPGQVLDYDGQAPVQVVLGRASGVEVVVRGQPFDTTSFASNRVARFEIK